MWDGHHGHIKSSYRYHQDIDMLRNDVEQSDDSHLLGICDVAAEELEGLCGSKI